MSKKKKTIEGYKKGAASLYVVIFTTLLLGIITLGFIRIMLSESRQTSDYDLSQSAYDAALAGVEDAKVALLLYQQCIAAGDRTSDRCRAAIEAMEAAGASEDCDIVRKILGRYDPSADNQETVIESGDANATGSAMDQAYTCVRILPNTDNYVSDLSDTNRVRMVPLRTSSTGGQASVKYISFSWFSDSDSAGDARIPEFTGTNGTNRVTDVVNQNNSFFDLIRPENVSQTPPVIEIELIQTSGEFTLSQLNTNSGATTNRGTLILVPSTTGTNLIDNSASVGLAASADKGANNPVPIICRGNASPYRCEVTIAIPVARDGSDADPRSNYTSFLRVSMPYGQPTSEFSVQLLDADKKPLMFDNVQSVVDSTGRANDLFRRVEARIEMADVFYPYPEFTLTLTGEDGDTLSKNFWVTQNAWNGANSGYVD